MPALVELFTVTAGAVESLRRAFSGVVVDTQAMRRNLDLGQGLALSEAVSMALAPKLGRSQAQAIVTRAALAVRAGQGTLGEALARDPEVVTTLDPDALAHALAPANFLGSAGRFIDQELARAQPHLDD